MTQRGHGQTPSTGSANAPPPPYALNPNYQHNQMMAMSGPRTLGPIQPSGPSQQAQQHQLAYQHINHQQQQQLQQQLQQFWSTQRQEIDNATDFKNHDLPLARIKKIMKADEDVRMISAEAPIVFARACEMFIRELTLRSWSHTEENRRRTLQKNDIAAAITKEDTFDFLVDIVPREDLKDEALTSTMQRVGGSSDGLISPYYYAQPPLAPQIAARGRGMGVPEQGVYGQQPQASFLQQMWPQQQPPEGYR